MIDFIQALIAFVFAVGVLITFHEFGHFWVARRCNVKIVRFSIGFGKPLWTRRFGEDRSEFVIAALPLGGYVKMLDEREGEVPAAERPRAFNAKPLLQRAAIVAAGPLFNFLFAIGAYWLIYMIGVEGLRPIIAEVGAGSPAARAGFEAGDEILRIDSRDTPTWTAVIDVTVGSVVRGRIIRLAVRDHNGAEREIELDMSRFSVDDLAGGRLLQQLGVKPRRPDAPAVIGTVNPGEAAERAGLLSGDRIVAVDGVAVRSWEHWVEIVRAHPRRMLSVELLRGGDRVVVDLTPEAVPDGDGLEMGRIGAAFHSGLAVDPELTGKESYAPLPALWKASAKSFEMGVITLRVLGKMIAGEASARNLSGPISIAQYAGESAGIGFLAFLGFLAIVSVSLGVLNLLPIPLLDGGHLMYYLIELVKGSPVSESFQVVGQQLGLAVLLGLMGLAFYNDILRIIG